jgi:hypothetical protein
MVSKPPGQDDRRFFFASLWVRWLCGFLCNLQAGEGIIALTVDRISAAILKEME